MEEYKDIDNSKNRIKENFNMSSALQTSYDQITSDFATIHEKYQEVLERILKCYNSKGKTLQERFDLPDDTILLENLRELSYIFKKIEDPLKFQISDVLIQYLSIIFLSKNPGLITQSIIILKLILYNYDNLKEAIPLFQFLPSLALGHCPIDSTILLTPAIQQHSLTCISYILLDQSDLVYHLIPLKIFDLCAQVIATTGSVEVQHSALQVIFLSLLLCNQNNLTGFKDPFIRSSSLNLPDFLFQFGGVVRESLSTGKPDLIGLYFILKIWSQILYSGFQITSDQQTAIYSLIDSTFSVPYEHEGDENDDYNNNPWIPLYELCGLLQLRSITPLQFIQNPVLYETVFSLIIRKNVHPKDMIGIFKGIFNFGSNAHDIMIKSGFIQRLLYISSAFDFTIKKEAFKIIASVLSNIGPLELTQLLVKSSEEKNAFYANGNQTPGSLLLSGFETDDIEISKMMVDIMRKISEIDHKLFPQIFEEEDIKNIIENLQEDDDTNNLAESLKEIIGITSTS